MSVACYQVDAFADRPFSGNPAAVCLLKEERDIEFASKPLETSNFQVENIKIAYVFYEDGFVVNVMYSIDNPKKRAVGFKLSEGIGVPNELEGKFKFVKQKSKLAGTIRGSFFVIKREY